MRTIDLTAANDLTDAGDDTDPARARFPHIAGFVEAMFADHDADTAAELRGWMLDQFDDLDPATHVEASVALNAVMLQFVGRDWLAAAVNKPDERGSDAARGAKMLREMSYMLRILYTLQHYGPSRQPGRIARDD